MQTERRLVAAGFAVASVLAMLAPLNSAAQQSAKLPRVGFLALGYGEPRVSNWFAPDLQALGWVDGKNVIFENRYADDKPERLPELAAELVRLKVDVLVAITNRAAFAAKKATSTIPIVVYGAHGGVETGLFASLAHPGGNITGLESLAPDVDAKRVELIKQIVPSMTQLAVIFGAGDPGSPFHLKSTRAAALALGIAVTPFEVHGPEDYERTYAAIVAKPFGGVLAFTDEVTDAMPISVPMRERKVPTVAELEYWVEAGCLASYGPPIAEFRQVTAQQIDKILKGAKPGDMPVQQATRFELVVNKKTARAIGISFPQSVLLRADKVIE